MLIFLLSPNIGEIILFSCNFCPPSTSMLGLLCLVYLSGSGTRGRGVSLRLSGFPIFTQISGSLVDGISSRASLARPG